MHANTCNAWFNNFQGNYIKLECSFAFIVNSFDIEERQVTNYFSTTSTCFPAASQAVNIPVEFELAGVNPDTEAVLDGGFIPGVGQGEAAELQDTLFASHQAFGWLKLCINTAPAVVWSVTDVEVNLVPQ